MNQNSSEINPIKVRIRYEANQFRVQIFQNEDEMLWVLQQMFGDMMGNAFFRLLKRDGECMIPFLRDAWFDEHLMVAQINADFNYVYPEQFSEIKEDDGQERTETENLQVS